MPGLFGEGALLIGEAGWTGWGKLAAGVWTYTDRQDDIRLTDIAGDPVGQRAQGGYALLEMPLDIQDGEPSDKATLFLRAGFSDGDTTPYSGGWQAGMLINRLFASRPDGQFSIGANQAFLSDKYPYQRKYRRNRARLTGAGGKSATGYHCGERSGPHDPAERGAGRTDHRGRARPVRAVERTEPPCWRVPDRFEG